MNRVARLADHDIQGPSVAILPDAFRFLLDRGALKALAPPASPTAEKLRLLAGRLAAERERAYFGPPPSGSSSCSRSGTGSATASVGWSRSGRRRS